MEKWEVEVSFIVAAPDRTKAWKIAEEICDKNLKGIASVKLVRREPVKDPEEWIAINE